jgi:hypothetical protein
MKNRIKTALELVSGACCVALMLSFVAPKDQNLPKGFLEIPYKGSEATEYVINVHQIVKVERHFDSQASLERGADKAWFILVDMSNGKSIKIFGMSDEDFWTQVRKVD